MDRGLRELDNSLKGIVAERIRAAIVTGQHKPGTRLVEQSLADEMGISRGPIREALQQLQQEGLVELNPRRGAIVTTLLPEQAAEVYTLRGHLEGLAVRLARPYWTADDTAFLQGVVHAMEGMDPDDLQGAIAADLRFHRRILEASRNQTLIQLYSTMDAKVTACFLTVKHHLRERLGWMPERHKRLVDALAQGDFWFAELLAMEHWAETALRFRTLGATLVAAEPNNQTAVSG